MLTQRAICNYGDQLAPLLKWLMLTLTDVKKKFVENA